MIKLILKSFSNEFRINIIEIYLYCLFFLMKINKFQYTDFFQFHVFLNIYGLQIHFLMHHALNDLEQFKPL